MSNPFQPAIDELEAETAHLEGQLRALTTTINFLRQKAGLPPRTPSGGTPGGIETASAGLNIQADTFFGKKMVTAAREYLASRKAATMPGPASPKEIFEALKAGGFQFNSKDDTNAKIVLGSMLRKYSNTFQKMPNGSYGLKAWYPDVRKPRSGQPHTDEPVSDPGDISSEDAFAGVHLGEYGSEPSHMRAAGS